MPTAAKRPCSYPGCHNLVKSGRCADHRQAEVTYHNPDHQRLYGTARWKRIRVAQLAKEPFCEECLRANIYTPATDVDHVKRHEGDPVLFFTGKLQSLCHACHSKKTAKEVFVATSSL
jgi:5-methylcytosine-specific restriction protein A